MVRPRCKRCGGLLDFGRDEETGEPQWECQNVQPGLVPIRNDAEHQAAWDNLSGDDVVKLTRQADQAMNHGDDEAMKFRKISEIVKAVRFDPYGAHKGKLPDCVIGREAWRIRCCGLYERIKPGDWIVYEDDHSGPRCFPDRGDGLAPMGCNQMTLSGHIESGD